jgi:2'-hydroxyisoflavone reductase
VRLLILGGTVFLGRHLVDAALERGHEVTLFNRGLTAPGLFADVEEIHGDREHDLGRLGGRSWDTVIDTSGYVPRVVSETAERLSDAVEHYTFVSSISVYGTYEQPGVTEDAPLPPLPEPDSEDVGRYYGELKAGCEREVEGVFGERALIARPGLIVGPHDPTERFTYWVARMADGGRVLAPAAPEQRVQLIDARDLAAWLLERREGGVFNLTGPAAPLTFGSMLERIRAVANPAAEIAWVDEDSLAEAGVEPWSDLPLWLDLPRHPELRGFLAADVSRALASGLTLRPLEDTIADTLDWVRERDAPPPPVKLGEVTLPRAGLSRERERELLAAA